MEKLLCASMMCANYERLIEEVRILDEAGIDIFHMDIMDGMFVPNFALGMEDFKVVRKNTKKLMDVHLMITNPYEYVEMFADMGADIIYLHPETDKYPIKTIEKIRKKGKIPGIAINPETSLESVNELLPLIDYFLILTTLPGFSGQVYMESVTKKIKRAIDCKNEYDFKLILEGAISPQRINEFSDAEIDGFVLGTTALFGKEEKCEEIILKLRTINSINQS